ncbi:MAG: hypothetical protein NC184_07575 [Roseburia sp.]|nr:hypothetical protein [Roseburia sp.]
MNRRLEKFKNSKLYKFLIKPPLWFYICVWVTFLVAVGACVFLYFIGYGAEMWTLAVYAVTLILLILSLYAVLAIIGVPQRAQHSKLVRRFFTDYGFRATVYAAGSVIFNTLYVVFGVIIAVVEHSPWLGALVGYHILLAACRGIVFLFVNGYGKENDRLYRLRAYSYCGVALILLSLALLPVIRLVIADMNSYRYFVSVLVYVSIIAAYAFIKLGIAIYNFRKAHKTDDMSLIAIKNISLADALITIFALQATMVKEFGDMPFGRNMNFALGAAVSFTIFCFGVYMFAVGIKRINRIKVAAGDGPEQSADETVEGVTETGAENNADENTAESVENSASTPAPNADGADANADAASDESKSEPL